MGNVGFSDQAVSVKQKDVTQKPLSAEDIQKVDAYWRAANYLSVGQIYLKDNPLLERPLSPEDIKPRLLGHWGTTPGLNFIYVHLNRVIKEHDLNMIYITGPGHGGPGIVANTYLEGTYSEIYPNISSDEAGLKRLFQQFSFPCALPTVLARISHDELTSLIQGYGWTPYFVEGDDPGKMHQLMAGTLDKVIAEIRTIQAEARSQNPSPSPSPKRGGENPPPSLIGKG